MTPRTFALDPTARILVAANQLPLPAGAGANASEVPSKLAVFRISDNGNLDFVRKYDVKADGGKMLFWMGLYYVSHHLMSSDRFFAPPI
jgi:6-phosphogluconolactonase